LIYSKGSNRAPWDAHYLLRPEIAESLFLAWRMTGDIKYRDYAWNIFQAIEKHCRLADGGYATVINVDSVPVVHEDKQETFFLVHDKAFCLEVSLLIFIPQSETLKYLYLIFSDTSVLPLTGALVVLLLNHYSHLRFSRNRIQH